MASSGVVLTEMRREGGFQLLRLTDDVGFKALGAAWIYDSEAHHWWYLLVSPLIDSKGPLWVYDRLLKVFEKRSLPDGITPLDIHIVSPREQGVANIPPQIVDLKAPECYVGTRERRVDDVPIAAMFVYRMRPLDRGAGDRARRFDSRVKDLLAA